MARLTSYEKAEQARKAMRQGTSARWEFEEKHSCGKGAKAHNWQPVYLYLADGGVADHHNHCYVVCLGCGALTYIETWWPGYMLSNAFDDLTTDKNEEE